MSKNAPKEITKKELEAALKSIKEAHIQYWNGYHLDKNEYDKLVAALKTLKRLPALIEYYVAVDES